MSPLLVVVTLGVYALAIALLWLDRSLRYLLTVLAGHLAMLLVPLWERLYGVDPTAGPQIPILGSIELSWPVVIGGGAVLALPVIVFFAGIRHKLWPRHYAAIWLGYGVFVLYFLLVDWLLERSGASLLTPAALVAGTPVPPVLVQAVLVAGASLGMLYALISTRHYSLSVALLLILLSGLVASLVFLGIFASPLWAAGFLGQSSTVVAAGALVSLLLVLWGVHLLAAGLHSARRQQLVWR